MNSSGSPLDARQNILVYLVIVVAAVFAFLAIIIAKAVKKSHEKPEYIAKQKSKPTTQSHVKKLCRILNLSDEEENLLWKICRDTKAPNILYFYTDDEYIESIFKKEFEHFIRSNARPELLYSLFRLRFRIYKIVSFSRNVTSSRAITQGTKLTYLATSGAEYEMELKKNDANGLTLILPDSLDSNNKDMPEKLSKMPLTFTLTNGQQYAIFARVVQFFSMPEQDRTVLVTHSNTVCPQSRRNSKRFVVNRDCNFSAVEVTQKPDGKVKLSPKENVYQGKVIDLSEGGCKLFSDLPIKQKQFIFLRIPVLDKIQDFYGQVVDTRTDFPSGKYSCHIAFKQVPLQQKVNLLTDLYGY